jgi:hypothetical protein
MFKIYLMYKINVMYKIHVILEAYITNLPYVVIHQIIHSILQGHEGFVLLL